MGTPTTSTAPYIARVIEIFQESGLKYTLHSAGTTIEGPWDKVTATIGKAHEAVHAMGIVRVHSDIRVGTRWVLLLFFHVFCLLAGYVYMDIMGLVVSGGIYERDKIYLTIIERLNRLSCLHIDFVTRRVYEVKITQNISTITKFNTNSTFIQTFFWLEPINIKLLKTRSILFLRSFQVQKTISVWRVFTNTHKYKSV